MFVLCYGYGVGYVSRQELPLDDEENEGPEQAKKEKDPMQCVLRIVVVCVCVVCGCGYGWWGA